MPKDSNIDICNRALALLGEPGISGFDAGTDAADACGRLYEAHVEGILGGRPWRFATQQVDLGLPVENATPLSRWQEARLIPLKYNFWLGTVLIQDVPIQFDRFEDKIYTHTTSEDDEVILEATWRIPEEYWPPAFKLYVEFHMAMVLAVPVTEQKELAETWRMEATLQLARAKHQDGSGRTTTSVPHSRFIQQRITGGRF